MLFEEKKRDFFGPKNYVETSYSYLDRSSRPESRRVREFIENWIGIYPNAETDELIARLRLPDTRSFDSAIFELIIFAIMSRLGCTVSVHPELDNDTGARPDFLISDSSGIEFYLEAVLASEYSQAEISAEKRKNVVLNALDEIESPYFFLGITAHGNPETPPSSRRLRNDLSQWLSTLDPDEVGAEIDSLGSSALPLFNWNHEDWRIKFEAWPRSADKRGPGKRTIGALSGGGRFLNTWEPIRNAVRSKGNHYGDLVKPLLVAINVNAVIVDRIDEMEGLFGQEEYVFDRDESSSPPQMRRKPNGAWYVASGPQYTRVSGAWIFANMNPWNIVSRRNTVYLNPWARLELPEIVRSLNHASVAGTKMRWEDGTPLAEVLELPQHWPE